MTTPWGPAPAASTAPGPATLATAVECPYPPPFVSSTVRPAPRAARTHPPPRPPSTAAPAPPGAARHATALQCPRPPPPASSTELPVPRAARTHPPPPAPATAAPAPPGVATPATAIPCPRLPPPGSPTELPVPPAARTHPPSQAPATAAPGPQAPSPSPPQAPAHLAWWSAPALRELRRWVKWAGGVGRRKKCTWCTLSGRSAPTPPRISTRPPQRPPCRRWHGKPSWGRGPGPLPPLHPPNPPPVDPDHPPPGMGHQRPGRPPPPPHHHHTGKGKGTGKGRASDGKGHPGKGARRGPK